MARPQDLLQDSTVRRRLKDNTARHPKGNMVRLRVLPQDSTMLPHRKASMRPSRATAAHQRSPLSDMDSKWPTWT